MQKKQVTRRKRQRSGLTEALSSALEHVRRGSAIAELAMSGSDTEIGIVFLLEELAKARQILDAGERGTAKQRAPEP